MKNQNKKKGTLLGRILDEELEKTEWACEKLVKVRSAQLMVETKNDYLRNLRRLLNGQSFRRPSRAQRTVLSHCDCPLDNELCDLLSIERGSSIALSLELSNL